MKSIGNVAKEINLTIRTLRFYDEIDLLKPSYVADSGYRYYSKRDVLKLQRIIALKSLGFHLHQIKSIMHQNKWEGVFEEQLAIITKEQEWLAYQEQLMRLCLHLSLIEQDISWETIFQYQEKMTHDQEQEITKFYKNQFDNREIEILSNPALDIGSQESSELVEILSIAREQRDDDPNSLKSQNLARRLKGFLDHTFDGDSKLINKLWDVQKHAAKDAGLITLEGDLIQYIDDIMDIYVAKLKEKNQ
ncbi:MerR family transcriptional regulator [Lentibacillus sp. CBA3610]|uniref:MerR family transcriptional regulator n=1 Tax=Lentibacillus sp. CBA3610 TaxID=2518176 RepID=UPI001594F6FD|nr:MerR family transcriptional regulator [Lentibacillus sp. CBA3610]QKY71244.1 MerR family transcriptional regulator [Lentibacillus sp. CBA3610]